MSSECHNELSLVMESAVARLVSRIPSSEIVKYKQSFAIKEVLLSNWQSVVL